jgi:DNA processing protein
MTIVSGLARGIDAAAHRGALDAGGRTVGVLACGLSNMYPPEHQPLADEAAARGAVISEMAMRREPRGGFFPQRNRIISGMSLGVLVVEAAPRSGALITARHAMEQGREVFAVPGPIDSPTSQGTNRLIADGAKLVQSVDDILEELGPLVEATPGPDDRPVHHPAELQLNEHEKRVLDLIGRQPTDVNEVIASSGMPPQQVLSIVTVLEMRRLVNRLSASVFSRR